MIVTLNNRAGKNEANVDNPKNGKSLLARFGPLGALVALMAFIYVMGWHRYFSFEQLAIHRKTITSLVQDHFILSLLGYAVLYAIVVALSLPVGLFLTILGGFFVRRSDRRHNHRHRGDSWGHADLFHCQNVAWRDPGATRWSVAGKSARWF